ncbi:hypothetical protein [Salinispora arenicola]|uniref:Uncharacterized protein n=2 Tax=Salinispora arenicola TaxID=168697 RepID=A0A542XMZ8_SALAC|nr:hypothetical protein [Salinispora arenicola]MCN0152099.1 hypothetical protein [Salinispora arenicola]MCN0177568.1 hypothetical protein [Salinispora arenicola]NIL39865.1 hypothetical protein [Salinispora arenicola]NIL59564.1 hypothetical protein [Salinispora arenicola]NIL61580.1 hypothetical protein [Salinispora arenicola]
MEQGGLDAVRELLLVMAVAVAGVLLALLVVFSPWHAVPDGAAPAAPVELRGPDPTATDG